MAKVKRANKAVKCKKLKGVFDKSLKRNPLMAIKALDRAEAFECPWAATKETDRRFRRRFKI